MDTSQLPARSVRRRCPDGCEQCREARVQHDGRHQGHPRSRTAQCDSQRGRQCDRQRRFSGLMNVAFAPRPSVLTLEADEPFVTLDGVTKVFGHGKRAMTALENVSLDMVKGEFVFILSASGCGKSTLLSLIAGLDKVT